MRRQIIAMGGGALPAELDNLLLVEYFLKQTRIPDGVAADDGVALHYIDDRLARVVASRPRARGYRVTRSGRRAVERRLPTRYLG